MEIVSHNEVLVGTNATRSIINHFFHTTNKSLKRQVSYLSMEHKFGTEASTCHQKLPQNFVCQYSRCGLQITDSIHC